MYPVLIALAAVFALIALWGIFAPRSFWRATVGWSVSRPIEDEPGGGTYAVRRLVAAAGLLAALAVIGSVVATQVAAEPRPAPVVTPIEQMWGSPEPHVVDRIVVPAIYDGVTEPTGLGTIQGFQVIGATVPSYLLRMPEFKLVGESNPTGLIGVEPASDQTGFAGATVVLAVRGPIECVPTQVVVSDTEAEVAIAIRYLNPAQSGGDPVESCVGGGFEATVLIPVRLPSALDGRPVTTFDGVAIPEVALIS